MSGFFLKAGSGLADESTPLATDASAGVAASAKSNGQNCIWCLNVRFSPFREVRPLMKFYDVALAQGFHDKVLTYDFFRLV